MVSELKQEIIKEARDLESYIIEKRRHIHMHPETCFEEFETSKFIEEELRAIGYETYHVAKTGIMAVIKGNKPGRVQEENDVPYKSKNPGKMHACGHDAHTAMLLGAAKIIYKYKEHIEGTIKLIFQPAEEGEGGGKLIVDEGLLDDVDYVYGLHVWGELPAGTIATRVGPFLASADSFTITIKGKGGHAAAPHQTFDPTAVLVDIYNALQKVVSREIDPLEHVVISSPILSGSDAHNIIPAEATIRGTFRTFNTEVREHIVKRMQEIVEGYSKAWRCTGVVKLDEPAYPPVINNKEAVEKAKEILADLDKVEEENLTMGGEDFAYYTLKTKGAFIVLGIDNKEKGIVYPHHHPRFNVDEAVLWKGTAVYALLGFFNNFT
ncbi:MAG: M20 metallopeptidase family protein [Candidatus Heimdallarchaeaceae archaeon]